MSDLWSSQNQNPSLQDRAEADCARRSMRLALPMLPDRRISQVALPYLHHRLSLALFVCTHAPPWEARIWLVPNQHVASHRTAWRDGYYRRFCHWAGRLDSLHWATRLSVPRVSRPTHARDSPHSSSNRLPSERMAELTSLQE